MIWESSRRRVVRAEKEEVWEGEGEGVILDQMRRRSLYVWTLRAGE